MITYTIGDDVISQTDGAGTTEFFLYDGQGSTRQLADASGAVNTDDSYSYDAYGVMLGGNPTATSPAATNYLYTGEQFDEHAQHYYLRARYYNPLNGRFNRMDPYAGSPQDPQSLHKYLYCHANPVNAIDPTGQFAIPSIVVKVAIIAVLLAVLYFALYRPLLRPLYLMTRSTPMPQEQIEEAVQEMRRFWPNERKMMRLADGLSGDIPIYSFRMLPPESYAEGMHFMGQMFINQDTVESANALFVALILFAEFQHYPAGGGLSEEAAQAEFVQIRRRLPERVRTPAINDLHHGGTDNEY